MSSEKLSEPKLLGIDQSLRDPGEGSTQPQPAAVILCYLSRGTETH